MFDESGPWNVLIYIHTHAAMRAFITAAVRVYFTDFVGLCARKLLDALLTIGGCVLVVIMYYGFRSIAHKADATIAVGFTNVANAAAGGALIVAA